LEVDERSGLTAMGAMRLFETAEPAETQHPIDLTTYPTKRKTLPSPLWIPGDREHERQIELEPIEQVPG
jgi:hypothetical protein